MSRLMISALFAAAMALSACSTNQVIDNTVGVAGFVTKTAVKGAVGAGKLAVNTVRGDSGER